MGQVVQSGLARLAEDPEKLFFTRRGLRAGLVYRDKSFSGLNGKISSGNFVRLDWKKSGPKGSIEMSEIPGSEFSLDVDLVFLAMGFLHVEHGTLTRDLNVALDERGNIKTRGSTQPLFPAFLLPAMQ